MNDALAEPLAEAPSAPPAAGPPSAAVSAGDGGTAPHEPPPKTSSAAWKAGRTRLPGSVSAPAGVQPASRDTNARQLAYAACVWIPSRRAATQSLVVLTVTM
jgi:hypothetical protein